MSTVAAPSCAAPAVVNRPAEPARLEDDAEVRALAALDDGAEAAAEAGIDDGPGNDADEGGEDEGGQAHPEQGGHDVDQPEWKKRHQPEDEKITQRVLLEPRFELADRGPGACPQGIAQSGPRDQKDDRGADCRPDHDGGGAGQRAEEESRRQGEDGRSGDRQPGRRGIDQGEEQRCERAEAADLGKQPFAMGGKLLEAEIAVEAKGEDGDDRRRQRGQGQHAARRERPPPGRMAGLDIHHSLPPAGSDARCRGSGSSGTSRLDVRFGLPGVPVGQCGLKSQSRGAPSVATLTYKERSRIQRPCFKGKS